jgi:hypothetical protein
MFALAPESRLRALLESAGFIQVVVEGIELERTYGTVEEYIAETADLSMMFSEVWATLDDSERSEVMERMGVLMTPYRSADRTLRLPGRSLVAAAGA